MKGAPEVKKERALSLWVVPSGDGKVRRFRFSYLSLFLIACLAGAVALSCVWVAGDYTRVQWQRLRTFFLMRQLEAERDSLAKREKDLNDENIKLRQQQETSLAYEQDVRQKLSELSQLLERATSLDVLEEDDGAEVAPPLEGAVGGAELDCSDNPDRRCAGLGAAFSGTAFSGAGEDPFDLSVKNKIARLSLPLGGGAPVEAEEGLVSLIDRHVQFLEALPLGKPTRQGKISSGFGFRYSPFTRHLSLHEGIDLSLSYGSNIHATAAGVVRRIDRNSTYGLMIDLEHSNKIITRYAHLSKTLVTEGSSVAAGDLLGYAGSSGRSTGPHLHYEVRVEGRAKNPRNFLTLAPEVRKLLLKL